MLLIRRFEERTEEQYTRARIGGYCHLAIGEEAANVGAIEPMEPGDYVLASYRDHGTALAVGSEPHRVMAELFGKATGVAGGYGGSMHLLDVERRFLGGWGIVGGQLPIAVGVGARARLREQAERGARASSERAPRTSAPSTSRSIWRRSGTCRSSSRSSTTATAWVPRSRWPRPSPSSGSAPRPTACTASASTAMTCWRCARRPAVCCAARATSGNRRCSRRRPTASAGTRWPTRARSTARPRRSPRRRSTIRSAVSWPRWGSTPRSVARLRSEVNAEIDAAIRQAAADPAPDPAGLFDNVYGDPGWREQFSPMQRGGPFGEREGTRAWRA